MENRISNKKNILFGGSNLGRDYIKKLSALIGCEKNLIEERPIVAISIYHSIKEYIEIFK